MAASQSATVQSSRRAHPHGCINDELGGSDGKEPNHIGSRHVHRGSTQQTAALGDSAVVAVLGMHSMPPSRAQPRPRPATP